MSALKRFILAPNATQSSVKEMPVAELFHFLRLEAETGKLYWLIACHAVRVGDEAGSVDRKGYREISIRGVRYKAHRIVFAMTHGRWPVGYVDHANLIVDDNRPSNLRECTPSENSRNMRFKGNAAGLKGAYRKRNSDKFESSIKANGHRRYLGTFQSEAEAHAAYCAASAELHGRFGRVS